MAIAVNYKYERRIGMFPMFFDGDGMMYGDTSFGDYPHYAGSSGMSQRINTATSIGSPNYATERIVRAKRSMSSATA
jgi:hypothetical protein